MTYNLKHNHAKNWEIQHPNEKPLFNIENEDDDQDIYISERSSISSSSGPHNIPDSIVKRLPTPTTSTVLSMPPKQVHTLRYPYNELPDNGIPSTTQYKLQSKEEKQKKKNIRKAPPGQGNLVSFPETKPPELGDNYYPYWYYYKAKNPDWIVRHRQTVDGQIIPYESIDPSQYAPQPALTTSPIKPRQKPLPTQRKSRPTNAPLLAMNQDKLRFDSLENNSVAMTHLTSHDNHEVHNRKHRSSPRQFVPLKDFDHHDHLQSNKRAIPPQRAQRKLKTESEWTENYLQTLSHGKPAQDTNTVMLTSNVINTRSKNNPKQSDKNSINSDIDDNNKQKYRLQQYQNRSLSRDNPSIAAQQPPNSTHHVRRRPPSGTHVSADFQVVDITFKKPERPSYLQPTRESPFHPPPIYNQTPHLPLIMRDSYQSQQQQFKTNTPRFPNEYYGTLARQTRTKEWDEPLEIPNIYKPDPQTRFYDRYLHNIIDKRLAV